MVAIDGARLAGPAVGDAEIAVAAPSIGLPSFVDKLRLDAKEGPCRRTRLEIGRAGSGVIRMPPVSVCHQVSTIGHFASPTTL